MKLLNLFKRLARKPPSLLGLTLDQTSLRLVELGKAGDGYLLRHCSQTPFPSTDSPQGFSLTHPEFLSFLKQTIQKSNLTTRQVALALPHSSVLFKSIELDKNLNETEIAIQVRCHAEQYFNYPLSELMMDFELLGDSKHHADLREVRWVAARRLEVESQLNALANAGLSVVAVEVDSFSLQRAASYYIKKHNMQSAKIAVIQIYDTHLLFIVLHQDICIYTRIENYAAGQYDDLDTTIFATVIHVLQLFITNELDDPLSLILLAGQPVCAELLDKILEKVGIKARYLDVFSLLNFFTPQASHEFAISTGLAMRVIL